MGCEVAVPDVGVDQGLRIDFALEVLILYYLPSCARLRLVVGMLRGLA